jgi:methyl-accepting chemotaxis protein
MPANIRRQFFVDTAVQGALILRALGYWIAVMITMVVILITWRMFTGPARVFYLHFDDLWFHYQLPLIAALLVLPLIVYDVVRFSSRFAGPIMRFRRAMNCLAQGEATQRLQFRAGDYWMELADDFNAVANRVEVLERQIHELKNNPGKSTAQAEPALAALPTQAPSHGKPAAAPPELRLLKTGPALEEEYLTCGQ